MKKNHISHFLTAVLCGCFVCSVPVVFAQEDASEEAAEATAETAEVAISQGRAAVLLANSLGLYVGYLDPLTPEQAIQLLIAEDISPLGGWEPQAEMNVNTIARLLAQALGLDEDFTDEQVSDPTSQAYKDALIAEYDVDIDSLVSSGILITSGPNPNEGFPVNSDQEETGDPEILVSEPDVRATLAALVPTTGGDGGQVDGGSTNVTPSAP
jgi:hypothetical protein